MAVATRLDGVPLDPGTRLVVNEADYLYGVGPVVVVVVELLGVAVLDGEPWVELRAQQIVIGGRIPRFITVRLGALKRGGQ
jgi:hypothetical protein